MGRDTDIDPKQKYQSHDSAYHVRRPSDSNITIEYHSAALPELYDASGLMA